MGMVLLLLGQTIVIALGAVFFWRRHKALRDEVAALTRTVAALEARALAAPVRKARRAESGVVTPVTEISTAPALTQLDTPIARAGRAWSKTARPEAEGNMRPAYLAIASLAPALAVFFGVDLSLAIAFGMAMAGAMLLIALRPHWTDAAWAGVAGAALWSALGIGLGEAALAPIAFAVPAAAAGVAGVHYAYKRELLPGALVASIALIAALALAATDGVIGAGGIASGAIIAAAALFGAANLRLEPLHMASFGAALAGLLILSGQEDAAIWFTPIATWVGALYLGIAVIRVPQLGGRGMALASVGVLAPLAMIAALHSAGHGLINAWAAAGAFAALAAMISGLIYAAAARRGRGLEALAATLWVLALGAFVAIAASISLALDPPFAALAAALAALALTGVDQRWPAAAWRACAALTMALAAFHALSTANLVLSEAPGWNPWLLTGLGLVGPALIAAAAAHFAERGRRMFTAGVLEAFAIAALLIAAGLTLRVVSTQGAMLLIPIGFVEACGHAAICLLASLALSARGHLGATQVRAAAAIALGLWGTFVALLSAALLLSPYWTTRGDGPHDLLARYDLGLLLPALALLGLWLYWRPRSAPLRARGALASGAILLAGAITVALLNWQDAPAWLPLLAGGSAFAGAIGVNFAPNVLRAQSSK